MPYFYAPDTDATYYSARKGARTHCEVPAPPDDVDMAHEYNAETGAWEVSPKKLAKKLRAERDKALVECDYVMMPDYPITTEKRSEWESYRKALRDITEQEGFPLQVTWPQKPRTDDGGDRTR